MTYTIKITNKNTDPNSKTADTIYFDNISPSLIVDQDTPHAEFIKDMTIRDGSICIPLWERQQFVRIPPNSVLIINTDDSSEAVYYRQMTVNNTAILVDPDPIQGSSGGGTLIEKTIMENGTYNAVDDGADGYSTVNVEVENSYTAEDNGKVVNNQALVAQTAYPTTITENDTYDTTNYNSITVNVASSGPILVAKLKFYISSKYFYFENNTNIIPEKFFQYDEDLESVEVLNNVTMIDEDAFDEASNLTSVTFESNSNLETINYNAFHSCVSLTSITIPRSVRSINTGAFRNCNSLESVVFETGSQLQYLSMNTFLGCEKLASITIPNSVTWIGDGAFCECSALKSITIPSSVTEIRENPFLDSGLTSITFESTQPPSLDGSLGIDTTCTIRVPQGSLQAYKSAQYYPDPSTYTYVGY